MSDVIDEPARASASAADLSAGPFLSRTEGVEAAIRNGILSGALPPGTPLVERDLAAQFQVSKTPVREALKALAKRGLVATTAYQRASVVRMDAHSVRAVFEVRAILEPPAVRLSVERAAAQTFMEATRALDRARRAIETASMVDLSRENRLFHGALFGGCDNELLIEYLDGLHDRVALGSLMGWRLNPTWLEELREHEVILEAVQQADPVDAERAVREHIERFGARLEHALNTTRA